MPGATIIFTDIVGFSEKPTPEQSRLVESLTEDIKKTLSGYRDTGMKKPSIICLPTGDGMAVAFIDSDSQQWNREDVFDFIFRLQSWAKDEETIKGRVALRVGVHVGLVEFVKDINSRRNICGDAINYAQRVMDAANPRQVLLSDAAFSHYIGTESPEYSATPFSHKCKANFEGPIDILAKHRKWIHVYKMTLQPSQPWWFNDDPSSKNDMVVSLTPLPKTIEGSFSDELENARRVALVQLTGERLLNAFYSKQLNLSPDIKRFWVFVPDPEWYPPSYLGHGRPTKSELQGYVEQWKELLKNIKGEHKFADLKLGLFKHPPFIGASYFDWETPEEGNQAGGKIHVSPYIWGVHSAECPGYELEWIGREQHPVYRTYVDGLNYLNANTPNALLEH